jgi:hypothetical protein
VPTFFHCSACAAVIAVTSSAAIRYERLFISTKSCESVRLNLPNRRGRSLETVPELSQYESDNIHTHGRIGQQAPIGRRPTQARRLRTGACPGSALHGQRESITARRETHAIAPTPPVPRPPALMSNSDDQDGVGVPAIYDCIGEPTHEHPSPGGARQRPCIGMLTDSCNRTSDLSSERTAEAWPSRLVVLRSVGEFGFRVRMERIGDQRSR